MDAQRFLKERRAMVYEVHCSNEKPSSEGPIHHFRRPPLPQLLPAQSDSSLGRVPDHGRRVQRNRPRQGEQRHRLRPGWQRPRGEKVRSIGADTRT